MFSGEKKNFLLIFTIRTYTRVTLKRILLGEGTETLREQKCRNKYVHIFLSINGIDSTEESGITNIVP